MHLDLRGRLRRLAFMAPSIVQCAVASALAWTVAKDVFGHARPFFAPIAVVVCIGVAVGQRLRRLVELVAGVSLGVGVGDLLIARIGSGSWQIALVVALAMGTAVFLDSGTLIVLQAGSSAVLVATLLPPSGTGGLDRMIDALIGGVLGIAAMALLPASPAAIVHRHAAAVLETLAAALGGAAEAVEKGDPEPAMAALRRARDAQSTMDAFGEALETGKEITTVSPLRRRRRQRFLRYETALTPLDHALRNIRVLCRRAVVAMQQQEVPPSRLPRALRDLAAAALLFRDELAAGRRPDGTAAAVLRAAALLAEAPAGRSGLSTDAVIAQVRSIVVDLLEATGADGETAAAALPPPAGPPSGRPPGPPIGGTDGGAGGGAAG
ncbi:aromatic acid exporter family protein [Planomonospora alba]|uniref:Aromatic acid exporter family protein n=1 Tax=Planomonospora alba TaxID=161354 RepID=A0ABP6NYN4_9ACTN